MVRSPESLRTRVVGLRWLHDGAALAERILELASDPNLCVSLGVRVRMAFERQWDKELALAKWEAVLRGVGEKPREADIQRGSIVHPSGRIWVRSRLLTISATSSAKLVTPREPPSQAWSKPT